MTTTCRCRFPASSTRPCSARPGWLPRPQRRNRPMSQYRLNLFIQHEHAKRLEELAAKKGVSKSSIVAAALASWLSPDAGDQREAAIAKRLDRCHGRSNAWSATRTSRSKRWRCSSATSSPSARRFPRPIEAARAQAGTLRAVRRTARPPSAARAQSGARRGGGAASRPDANG